MTDKPDNFDDLEDPDFEKLLKELAENNGLAVHIEEDGTESIAVDLGSLFPLMTQATQDALNAVIQFTRNLVEDRYPQDQILADLIGIRLLYFHFLIVRKIIDQNIVTAESRLTPEHIEKLKEVATTTRIFTGVDNPSGKPN